METIDTNFQQFSGRFAKQLTSEAHNDFKSTSLEDVLIAIRSIQEEQAMQKNLMNLPRIQPFLEAMRHFGTIIETFNSASSLACFIWGPIKLCLMVTSTWTESFDVLLKAYQRLAEKLPNFTEYMSLFSASSRMGSVLASIYENIFDFHRAVLDVLKKPAWKLVFHSLWKDFEFHFKHILDDLHHQKILIESFPTAVQIEQSQLDAAFSRAQHVKAEESRYQQKHLVVLTWLSAIDSSLDQEAAVETRRTYPTSGQWLLQNSNVKAWLDENDSSKPLLWMNGILGAGKTIMTSVIIEECQNILTTTLCYFFCSHQDARRNTFLAIARAFLVQILCQNRDILPYLYDQCISSGQVSLESIHLCRQILQTALKTASRKVYIIIDGLDQCDLLERENILSFFTPLVEKEAASGQLRAFFVSRDEIDIHTLLKTASVLRLSNSQADCQNDLEGYTQHWCSRIKRKFDLSDETTDYIETSVCERACGMFLFAKLVLANLYGQTTVKELYSELGSDKFPLGLETAYARIVARIYQSPYSKDYETVHKLLGWIACSKRSLKWHEIQGATSIDTSEHDVDFEKRRLIVHVKEFCGSLVDILPGDRVQLVHVTAKTYLIDNGYIQISHEEQKLAILCLKYLLFDCFDPNLSDDSIQEYTSAGYYAFQDYAILHWVDHLEASIPFLLTDAVDNNNELGSVINDLYEAYGLHGASQDDIFTELKDRCRHLENADYFYPLLLLISHTRRIRQKEETIVALGDLGSLMSRQRALLEALFSSRHLDIPLTANLEQCHGKNWFKCPRHACFYFHEGFRDSTAREIHVSRHERPFSCTESNCLWRYIGFVTEKELEKHIKIKHTDTAMLFPKTKKPTAKHVCNVCSKAFTRAHSLNAHKMTHRSVRPYPCRFCDRTFVRKYVCERHVKVQHLYIEDQNSQDGKIVGKQASSPLAQTIKYEPSNPPVGILHNMESNIMEDWAGHHKLLDDAAEGVFKHSRFELLHTQGTFFNQSDVNLQGINRPSTLLQEALSCRNTGHVRTILTEQFEEASTGDFAWLHEWDEMGHSCDEMVNFLMEDAIDSPWIFFEPSADPPAGIQSRLHAPGCVHQSSAKSTLPGTQSVMQQRPANVTGGRDTKNLVQELCGIAGIAPKSRNGGDWTGKVKFEEENSVSIVSFGLTLEEKTMLDHRPLVDRTLNALRRFNIAVGQVQKGGLCCDSFTVIRHCRALEATETAQLELRRVDLDLPVRLLEELQILVHLDIIEVSGALQCQQTAAQILHTLTRTPLMISQEPSLDETLHLCSLAVQFLCLGFLSYSQAHIGAIQPFFLDTPQKRIMLMGNEHSGCYQYILAELKNLTCIGKMTRGPVLTFRMLQSNGDIDSSNNDTKHDIFTSAEDLLDTWGPGNLIFRKDSNDRPCAISVGGGIISAADGTEAKFHWSPEVGIDGPFPVQFDPSAKILIGALVSVNKNCLINETKCWQESCASLENLGTYRTHWQPSERQTGIQFGPQYVLGQLNQTWWKVPGKTLKQFQLEQDDDMLIPFLENVFGLQVSFCTGVARRVPLRELVADVLPIFAKTLLTTANSWDDSVTSSLIIDAFRASSLQESLSKLSPTAITFALKLVRRILEMLQHTGIDFEGKHLTIAWPREGDVQRCFKIPCDKQSFWTHLLADSEDCATFAYISAKCLESEKVKCNGPPQVWQNASTLLETAVIHHQSKPITQPCSLEHKKLYFFQKLDSLFVVKVHRPNEAENARLVASQSKMQRRFQQRFIMSEEWKRQSRLRERQVLTEIAEEVLVLALMTS